MCTRLSFLVHPRTIGDSGVEATTAITMGVVNVTCMYMQRFIADQWIVNYCTDLECICDVRGQDRAHEEIVQFLSTLCAISTAV